MVLLAASDQLAAAARLYADSIHSHPKAEDLSLSSTPPGGPVKHEQVIAIARWLGSDVARSRRGAEALPTTLNGLLNGCRIYQPPKQEPKEQTEQYKRLMARLRKEEEARSYERMVASSSEKAGLSLQQTGTEVDEDEITFTEVKRQATMIINVFVSIVCTAVFLWIAARRWNLEARLALSMLGALVVAVAEVVIYSGYLRRLREAKQIEKRKVEVKSVESTWVIEGQKQTSETRRRIKADKNNDEKH